jgi:malic enzyme
MHRRWRPDVGLLKGVKLTKRDPKKTKIVLSGAGAAAIATYRLLVRYGIDPKRSRQ